jgi:hypothetical protein
MLLEEGTMHQEHPMILIGLTDTIQLLYSGDHVRLCLSLAIELALLLWTNFFTQSVDLPEQSIIILLNSEFIKNLSKVKQIFKLMNWF